jgi:type VI secretion system protein ImpA
MAVLDTGKLLAPVAGDSPSGLNLEYDPAFLKLEKDAQGKDEQVIGSVTSAAEPPDWNVVCEQALQLLERTKDLRVAAHLARGLLHKQGVSAFAEGLSLIRGLLESQWATVHPQLDPDDDNDPTMRITALAALTASPVVVALRAAPLLISRVLGPLSLNDIVPTEGTPDSARIQGIFMEASLAELEACAGALKSGHGDLQAVDQIFETHTGSRGPDMTTLLRYFHQAGQALQPRLEERRAAEQASSGAVGDAPAAAGGVSSARALSGDILSREDVVRAFDKICAYFQRHEPSSPIPLLVERCKRLVTMDFLEILQDMAPDGVNQAQVVTGKRGDGK